MRGRLLYFFLVMVLFPRGCIFLFFFIGDDMGKLLLLLNEFLLLRRGEDEVCGRIFLCFAYLLIDVEAVDGLRWL